MEKEHIENILKKVKDALNKNDASKIKEMSNWVLHSSSIDQEPVVISLAVMIYSLSKFLERDNYSNYPGWKKFLSLYKKSIDEMLESLKKDDTEYFTKTIERMIKEIEKLSGSLKTIITEVINKAKINKASRIYEHGISMEKTAKILGISVWELTEYIGKSGNFEHDFTISLPIKQRIKIAEDIFR